MKNSKLVTVIYILSFFSGTAALMYEIVWFRSLSLIFGGTTLAVTTTVAVFMGGLSLGNWCAGRLLIKWKDLLLSYALIELGIAVSAFLFMMLIRIYPDLYVLFARFAPESSGYLTLIRIFFSIMAMLAPTTLMGATIPILVAFASNRVAMVGRHISYLYGLNTLGAVVGVLVVGFYLLHVMPISGVTIMAVFLNLTIAGVCWCCRTFLPMDELKTEEEVNDESCQIEIIDPVPNFAYKLVLLGIGFSGFCALAYEILWTRVLILFLDNSVYSFTIVLAAFLLGISLGGMSYSLLFERLLRRFKQKTIRIRPFIITFGAVQVLIGLSILLLMHSIFDIPTYFIKISRIFYVITKGIYSSHQISNFTFSFFFLLLPSFFMGSAVPLAVKITAVYRRKSGEAAGEVLAVNTIGSILGSAVSGFLLIRLFGIERSMQIFVLINICVGLVVMIGIYNRKRAVAIIVAGFVGGMFLLAGNESAFRFWDVRYLANILPKMTPLYGGREKIDRYLNSKELLYYAEGSESIVSSSRDKRSGLLTFTTNGRIEASTVLQDVQVMFMLGHVPMLLHKNPKNVLVVGAGSGMTLGAVSIYPSLEKVTLAEIEPKVLGVTETFRDWNHNVLKSDKLDVVFNDGRNYLLTTDKLFDVITSDPINPMSRGSGYLYTDEYFKLISHRLAPGGIACQWLPLYNMSTTDIKSTIRTFSKNFKRIMLWLTLTDVGLFGSNDQIKIDEAQIAERMKIPGVAYDLNSTYMGPTTEDLLTYFLMGDTQARKFSTGAILNTDNNVFLEYSSPLTFGISTEYSNISSLLEFKENVAPYLNTLSNDKEQPRRDDKWKSWERLSDTIKKAHIMYLGLKSPLKKNNSKEKINEIAKELETAPSIGILKAFKKIFLGS